MLTCPKHRAWFSLQPPVRCTFGLSMFIFEKNPKNLKKPVEITLSDGTIYSNTTLLHICDIIVLPVFNFVYLLEPMKIHIYLFIYYLSGKFLYRRPLQTALSLFLLYEEMEGTQIQTMIPFLGPLKRSRPSLSVRPFNYWTCIYSIC